LFLEIKAKMPTYEYKCKACKHEFEKFQSITSNPARKCPSCGKLGVERLIGTGAGIIFKGSGFYETDYKRAGSKKPDCPAETKTAKSEKPAEVAGKSATSEVSSSKVTTESCKSCAKAESCPGSKAGKE
jgi:putative FmdB family regulatory protein